MVYYSGKPFDSHAGPNLSIVEAPTIFPSKTVLVFPIP